MGVVLRCFCSAQAPALPGCDVAVALPAVTSRVGGSESERAAVMSTRAQHRSVGQRANEKMLVT